MKKLLIAFTAIVATVAIAQEAPVATPVAAENGEKKAEAEVAPAQQAPRLPGALQQWNEARINLMRFENAFFSENAEAKALDEKMKALREELKTLHKQRRALLEQNEEWKALNEKAQAGMQKNLRRQPPPPAKRRVRGDAEAAKPDAPEAAEVKAAEEVKAE